MEDPGMVDGAAPAVPAPTVLVVATSPDLRRDVGRALEERGHGVLEADGAAAAIAALRGRRPAVALVDAALLAAGSPLRTAMDEEDLAVPVVALAEDAGAPGVAAAHDVLRLPVDPAELAVRVAAAARTATLLDQLEGVTHDRALSTRTDPLTGLYNRRHLDEQLRALGASAFRHAHPLAALMIDIDGFRAVNEARGAAFGDVVLCVVAARLRSSMRLEDVLGRWGGEEFLVLLPFTDGDRATILAERIRARVGAEPVRLGDGGPVPITVSVGVASGDGSDAEAIVRAADVALYRAKQAGRDRVERAGERAPASG